jgi:hypothetical protein
MRCDFIVLDFLRCANQGGVENRTRFDFFDPLLSFLNQSFHRNTLDTLRLDATLFDDLVNSPDLTMRFLQVGLEGRGQIGIGLAASHLGERLPQLLLRAIGIRKSVDKQVLHCPGGHGSSLVSER